MPKLQRGQIGVGLVGDEHLEAVAIGVGGAELSSRMEVLTPADRPGALRPAGMLQRVQFGDLGTRAHLAAGIDRRSPRRCRGGQHRGAHALIGRQADREPHATLAEMAGQRGGGADGAGADQQRLRSGGAWQLRQRQVDHLDVVGGGGGAGVARPQEARQRLAGASPPSK